MLNWKNNFAPRPDGRYNGTLSAVMHRLRELTPALAFTDEHCQSPEAFAAWREKVIQQLKVRLQMPPVTAEPPPCLLPPGTGTLWNAGSFTPILTVPCRY